MIEVGRILCEMPAQQNYASYLSIELVEGAEKAVMEDLSLRIRIRC